MDITVVIPTFNRYKFLKRAIESVLVQSYQAKEIIVVDDGSCDETATITQSYPTVKYIYQKNRGVSSARNLGVQNASCEWVAFLDSDDVWYEEKLQKQVNFHEQNSHVLISYTDEIWVRDAKEIKIPKKFKKIGKDAFLENISYCNIAPSSVLLHKKLFDIYGIFDESLEVCEDYDFWLRVALKHEIALVDEKLITKYAGHKNQLSFKYWGMDRFRVKSLEKLLKTENIDLEKKELLREELLKKYTLLLKGARKHEKEEELYYYEKKIELF